MKAKKKAVVSRAKRLDLAATRDLVAIKLGQRVVALEGVMRQLQKEAGKRAETMVSPEKERWEWVVRATTSALEAK